MKILKIFLFSYILAPNFFSVNVPEYKVELEIKETIGIIKYASTIVIFGLSLIFR